MKGVTVTPIGEHGARMVIHCTGEQHEFTHPGTDGGRWSSPRCHGLPCEMARHALKAFRREFTPLASAQWVRAGCQYVADVRQWTSAHITAATAADWAETDLAPSQVMRCLRAGLSPEDAQRWITAGVSAYDMEKWAANGQSLATATGWKSIDADYATFALFGAGALTPEQAAAYTKASGSESPAVAARWYQHFPDASEARHWQTGTTFLAPQAVEWHNGGYSPAEAARWQHLGTSHMITPTGLDWALTRGLTPAEVSLWAEFVRRHPRVSTATDLADPAAVASGWIDEGFDPYSAASWVLAGVTVPTHAAGYRDGGLDAAAFTERQEQGARTVTVAGCDSHAITVEWTSPKRAKWTVHGHDASVEKIAKAFGSGMTGCEQVVAVAKSLVGRCADHGEALAFAAADTNGMPSNWMRTAGLRRPLFSQWSAALDENQPLAS